MKLETQQLLEAFVNKRNELGETKFSATKMTDAHVKEVIKKISKKLGIPETEIITKIESQIKKFDDIAKIAPILYSTIQQNIVENEIFTEFQKHEIEVEKASKFDKDVFMDLFDHIKLEHDQFFPLRNFINHKSLHNPNIVFIPSPYKRHEEFNDVDTAAATPTGDFIFNLNFMQKLIDFAYIKKIKPKGKKYVSNGGRIPDDYCYIEFLILHELMHYTYSDFHYQKILKTSGKIINWVGDFRSNYLLVKSGYEQLPMGLFNDHINYDRQKTYKEMHDIVKSEFEKLNKDQQERVENKLGEMGDDHDHSEDGTEPGENATPESIDNHHGKTERTFGGSGDESKVPDGKKKESNPSDKKDTKGGRGSGGADTIQNIDYSQIKPKFNWKTLLNNMVSSASEETEETYQKPNKKNATGAVILQQTGKSSVKPGEITADSKLKLCFVVDSSGSMGHAAATIFANLEKLIKSSAAILNKNLVMIKFSNSHLEYELDLKSNKYVSLTNGKLDKSKPSGTIKDLFSEFLGSSTNFTEPLAHQISEYAKKQYNVLILTDTDILAGGNFEELQKIYKNHKKNLFMILDSKESFVETIAKFKEVPKNFSYFS